MKYSMEIKEFDHVGMVRSRTEREGAATGWEGKEGCITG